MNLHFLVRSLSSFFIRCVQQTAPIDVTNSAFSKQISVSQDVFSFKALPAYNEQSI